MVEVGKMAAPWFARLVVRAHENRLAEAEFDHLHGSSDKNSDAEVRSISLGFRAQITIEV